MSRIQRILSKAERDGTAARLTWEEGDGSRRDRSLAVPRAWRGGATAEAPVEAPAMDEVGSAEELSRGDIREDVLAAEPRAGAVDRPLGKAVSPPRPLPDVTLSPLLVAAHQPHSPGSEQYRSLRTRVSQNDTNGSRRVVAVTSPCRGDGKSVTAANLALSMAQEFDRRVLLVDADLRNARVHSLFGIHRQPGLVEVLSGAVQIDEALVSLPDSRLVVLVAGGPHAQATELLASVQMRQLFEILRRQFDRIIVDAAVAHTADTGALHAAVDSLLVVVRAAHTPRPSIERALDALPAPKVMGLVLNDSRAGDGFSQG